MQSLLFNIRCLLHEIFQGNQRVSIQVRHSKQSFYIILPRKAKVVTYKSIIDTEIS